ncbi:hypothetical protein [Frisingicoccus sp.]|uniref:hypothetical protein n=1 Tax=Frisingicoccus sp. TaxID=1918627 RepID=UPI0025B9D00D|nr:hypothetical protein [Frisingicoccus sp.]MDY5955628.1 hypothetical protein [Frisingicoccus sp.]
MQEIFLVGILVLIGIVGYYIIEKVGRYLEECAKMKMDDHYPVTDQQKTSGKISDPAKIKMKEKNYG